MQTVVNKVQQGKENDFTVNCDGVLRYGEQLCVLKINELRREILEEDHKSSYSVHLGGTKMN